MSFAPVHQNKNKVSDSENSTLVKPSRHLRVNNWAMTPHASIVHLQRTIGNQALQRLLHSNTRFDFARIGIHAKLNVSQPGNIYEQEADRVAEGHINRKCSACKMKKEKGEEEESLDITRKPSAGTGFEVNNEVTNEISNVVSSGGSSLDNETKELMESRFGYDFSRVRVYADKQAAESAEAMNALAYTVGRDIVFGTSQYAPRSKEGQKLLAHELTHVVQAGGNASNSVHPPSSVDTLEHEARRVNAAFSSGSSLPPILGSARGLTAPLRSDGDYRWTPTYGPIPGDPLTGRLQQPKAGIARFELFRGPKSDIWFEEHSGGFVQRASGHYDYVIIKDKIWAVKSGPGIGHLEASQGQPITWGGQMEIGSNGRLKYWDSDTGHYLLPERAKGLGPSAKSQLPGQIHRDLPLDNYHQLNPAELDKRRQLPVYRRPPDMPPGGLAPTEPPAKAVSGQTGGSPTAPPAPAQAKPTTPTKPPPVTPPTTTVAETAPPSKIGIRTPSSMTSVQNVSVEADKILANLDREISAMKQFTVRVQAYTRFFGGVFQALDYITAYTSATEILNSGFAFPEVIAKVNNTYAQAEEVLRYANQVYDDSPSLVELVRIVNTAIENKDTKTLNAIAIGISDYLKDLREFFKNVDLDYDEIDARCDQLIKLRDMFQDPKLIAGASALSYTTATGVELIRIAASFEKLASVRGAAEKYKEAYTLLKPLIDFLDQLSSIASDNYWEIYQLEIVKKQREIDQEMERNRFYSHIKGAE
jgi:hypothetical protein